MTAPRTNVEKQKRRHSPALIGIAVAGVIVLLVVLFVVPQDLNEEDEVVAPEATATEPAGN